MGGIFYGNFKMGPGLNLSSPLRFKVFGNI